jgi:hypothetical protein
MVIPRALGSAIVVRAHLPLRAAAYGWLARPVFEAGQQCRKAEKMRIAAQYNQPSRFIDG